MRELLPYLGLLPALITIISLIRNFQKGKTKKSEIILQSLANKGLIADHQKLLLSNIDFLKTQGVRLNVDGVITFYVEPPVKRFLYSSISILLGVFWFASFFIFDHGFYYETWVQTFYYYIGYFVLMGIILAGYISFNRKAHVNLEENTIRLITLLEPKKSDITEIKIADADIQFESKKIIFRDEDNEIKVSIALSSLYEAKLWENLFDESIEIANRT
jgi:hypothetical protein